MILLVKSDVYNELAEKYIEKSSHRTEKVRKLVQIHRNRGKDYQAYRWVNVMSGNMPRIDKRYKAADATAKAQYNSKVIVNKDFRDLTPLEVEQFINRAKNEFYYYDSKGVHVAYGNEKGKDKEKYLKELNDCKILVRTGHEVYWLPEYYAKDELGNKKHGDTITDDRTLEFKDTDNDIKDSYKKGRKQAMDLFIRIKDPMTTSKAIDILDDYIDTINYSNKKKKIPKVNFEGRLYFYFEKSKQLRLFVFDKNGNWKEEISKKNGRSR